MLCILLIQVRLKFIMYNKHKCSNCQKGNISQTLATNCQDWYLGSVSLSDRIITVTSLTSLLNSVSSII